MDTNTSSIDIRALLAAVSNAPPVECDIEGLGRVYIRRITLGETEDINKSSEHTSSIRLLARFLGNADGTPAFNLKVADDLAKLQAIPAVIAGRLLAAGNGVNVPKENTEKKD